MKQITSFWLLMFFFASTALFAQNASTNALEQFKMEQMQNQTTSNDVDVERILTDPSLSLGTEQTRMQARKVINGTDAQWDVLYTFSAQAPSCQAVTTDGNNFYMTYWNGAGLFDKFDMDGNYIESFTISAASAIRDFAYDGTYFYGAPSGGMSIAVLDLANQTLVSTIAISSTAGVTGSRHLAYDPGLDNGNGGFWLGQWSELAAIDMSGNTIHANSETPAVASCYGSAYDPYSTAGAPKLWLFTQNAGASTYDLIMLEEFDINTLSFTGFTLDLFTISGNIPGYIPGTSASSTIAGGAQGYVDANNKYVLAVNFQQSPNLVAGLELGDAGPGLPNDVGISSIPSPVSGYDLTGAETVTIKLNNFGTNAQSNIPYEVTWDGPTGAQTINETYTGPLAAGDFTEITLAATADLSAFGEYTFTACTQLVGDENTTNDCKSKTVSNLAAPTVVYPQSADRWTGTTNGTDITETSLVKGVDTEDGWFVFDITSIPEGATITSVTFHGYVYETYYPYWSLTPLTLDPLTAEPAALKAEIEANSATGVAYSYNNEASTFAVGWHEYLLSGTANADMTAALAQGWFAMGMDSRDNSATYFVNFEGWNETNVPYLEVEYSGGNPPTAFSEETFEDYTAGDYLMQQAIAQGKTYWSTWSAAPGTAEDPLVSNAAAYAGSNSVVIEGTNDAVLYLNDEGAFTEGVYTLEFNVYIPTGMNGYFNVLQLFDGAASEWGMQAYFDVAGAGLVDAGAAGSGVFTYTYDTWHNVKMEVDLDADFAKMYFNDAMLVSWVWSSGSFGTGTLNELHAMNFYAWDANGTPGAHFDNISITEGGIPSPLDPVTEFAAAFVANQGVETSWVDPPVGSEGTWVGYDDGVNVGGLGLQDGGTFWGAIRWDADDLTQFNGKYITEFKFFPNLFATEAEFTFMIWEGADAATLVYEQALSDLTWDEWNTISLDEMYMIDASIELWIGLKVVHVEGENPFGLDAGPAVAGYGDMVTFDGVSWESMSIAYGIDNNFNLKAFVADEVDGVVGDKTPLAMSTISNPNTNLVVADLKPTVCPSNNMREDFLGVNIYRDDALVNDTPVAPGVQAYTDAYFVGGTYTYTAKAVYDEGLSPATPGVEVTIPTSGGPEISVNPTSLSETHVVNNTQTEQTLTITNTGTGQLDWSIAVDLGGTDAQQSNVDPIDPAVYAQLLAQRQASEGMVSSTGLATISTYSSTSEKAIPEYLTKYMSRDMVFAYNAYDPSGALVEGPITFDTDTPGTLTLLAPTSSTDFIAGGCWAFDTWYGVQYGGGLYSIDTESGDMTYVGASQDMSGLAFDGTTLYGASITDLFEVDPATGVCTPIGALGTTGALMIGIGCDAGGDLYGFDIGDDTFYSIDKASGAATAVGAMGQNFNYAQDMAFDKTNDICYVSGYTTTGGLFTVDVATGVATLVGNFAGGAEITGFAIPGEGITYTNDVGVSSIMSPVTGVELGNAEPVVIKIKNYGTASQSGFGWEVTWDGPTGAGSFSGTFSGTLAGGETAEITAGNADLSTIGDYGFEACTSLSGDENPDNDCKTKVVTNLEPSLCIEDLYSSGCTYGDGLIAWDFADVNVPDIPCAGTPPWYHDYRDMVHSLEAGETYTLTATAGYNDTYFDVWIDFNDDLLLTDDEIILNDGFCATASTPVTFEVTIPATAADGSHVLRFRTNWTAIVEDACATYSYGNCCDFTAQVGENPQGDWLSVNIDNGSLGTGESTDVTVTFDSQDLEDGTYIGALMVSSNDPGTPMVDVPATLFVGAEGPAISVNPQQLDETHLNAPEQTTQTLYISNVGTEALDWSLVVDLGGTNAQQSNVDPIDPEVYAQLLAERRASEGFPISLAKTSNPTPSPNQTDDEVIRYDDGVNNDAIGLTAGGTFQVAAYWPASTMGQYAGMKLSQVEVYINDLPSSFVLKVYDAGTTTVPGTLLHEETVAVTAVSWNVIELSQQVDISGDDIWIGYEVTHAVDVFSAGCDIGPAVAGYGDMISFDGTTFESMAGLGLDYNWNIASTLISGELLPNDVGVQTILTPVTGVELGMEAVTFIIKNYGTASQSNIPWTVTWTGVGSGTLSGTFAGSLAAGATAEVNAGNADLSAFGDYSFEACTSLSGDENSANDCKTKTVTNLEPSLCVENLYSTGCSLGDGLIAWDFSDVNVPDIPCAGTPPWYHDYRDMVHSLEAGETYTLTATAGYNDTYFDVWIDFNDDLLLTDDEIILNDGFCATASTPVTFEVTIPATAADGSHVLRFRTNWTAIVEDACATYSYGNCCDFTAQVGENPQADWLSVDLDNGTIEAGGSQPIEVTFDSQGLTNGTYMGALMISSNDSATPMVEVPVTLVVGGTTSIIFEPFEDYDADDYLVQQAVNQGKEYWTTWSNSPGGAEDPLVSDAYAYEGDNSVVITGTNDAVLLINQTGLTTGQYNLDFWVLIPTGFNGYFNVLQAFAGATSEWGMQAYFDANGAGLVDAGGAGAGVFTYTYDTWHNVNMMVDLDLDYAEMYFNNELVVSWMWSSGSFGTGILNELHAMNFYAWADNGTPGAHFDHIDITSGITPVASWDPGEFFFALYPNQIDTQYLEVSNVGTGTLNVNMSITYGAATAPSTTPVQYVNVINPDQIGLANTTTPTPSPNQTDDEVIRYDDGVNNDAIGLTSGGTFEVSAYWPSSSMGQYIGMKLTQVEIYINDAPTSLVLKIYDQGTPTNPGNVLHEQTVSVDPLMWNMIDLTEEVDITGEDIWIGYEVTHAVDMFCAGCDAGPAVAGFGDMISLDATTFEPMSALGLDYNWNIAATLTGEASVEWLSILPLSADIQAGQSTPFDVIVDTYGFDLMDPIYHASIWMATNDPGNLMVEIPVTLDLIDAINEGEAGKAYIMMFPNPGKDVVNISTNYELNHVVVMNQVGQVVLEMNVSGNSVQLNTSNLQSGIYFVKINSEAGESIQKLIVQ